jgi:hypothetical protein
MNDLVVIDIDNLDESMSYDNSLTANIKKRKLTELSGIVDLTFDNDIQIYEEQQDPIKVFISSNALVKKYHESIVVLSMMKVGNSSSGTSIKPQKKVKKVKLRSGIGYGGDSNSGLISKSATVNRAKSILDLEDQQSSNAFSIINYCLKANDVLDEQVIAEFSNTSAILLWALCFYLKNDSLLDICERYELYESIFSLIFYIATEKNLVDKLVSTSSSSSSSLLLSSGAEKGDTESCTLLNCHVLLRDLYTQSQTFLRLQRTAGNMIDEEFMVSYYFRVLFTFIINNLIYFNN